MGQEPPQPPKRTKVEQEVIRLLNAHRYHEGRHALRRMREREITRMEIEYVRRNGRRALKHDQRTEDATAWKYAFEGTTMDGRKLRVLVFLENQRLEIATVIDLKR